jgi:CTP:molybdopterin cytidylyltransferase MocA
VVTAAIILAGGESRRMGTPKPLLAWGGEVGTHSTLVEYQIGELSRAGVERIAVILGYRADEVRPLVHAAGAQAIVNELYAEGRASSVRVGAAALPESTEAVVILNVDQPRPAEVTRRLLAEHRGRRALITVPVRDGRRGHPVVLDGSLLPEIREVSESTQGLRAVIDRHARLVHEVPFDSPVVLLDLNEPGEYKRARNTYFGAVTK